ncbi:glycine cleavage system protein GcvH [Candidatus Woesearchaeota archaeon]|nr:glycine cleavage system protein GcvH [Candidatus Woesearchaeota archaeon]
MEFPEDLRYSKDHEWVKKEGDSFIVGVTDFAQKQLTDIVFVELPEKGKKAEAGKQLAVIESVKSVSDVFSPITGEVAEANEKLSDSPDIINKDPYGEGWIAKLKADDEKELEGLMPAGEYKKLVEKEES